MIKAVFRKKWLVFAAICLAFVFGGYTWFKVSEHDYTSIEELASNPANIQALS